MPLLLSSCNLEFGPGGPPYFTDLNCREDAAAEQMKNGNPSRARPRLHCLRCSCCTRWPWQGGGVLVTLVRPAVQLMHRQLPYDVSMRWPATAGATCLVPHR